LNGNAWKELRRRGTKERIERIEQELRKERRKKEEGRKKRRLDGRERRDKPE